MKKLLFCVMLILIAWGSLFAETFYLYIEESCNDIEGVYLYEVREGIFSALFNLGHIIFDDATDDGCGNRFKKNDFAKPLNVAFIGGANYLIAVRIDTTTTANPAPYAQIISTATFFLIHVETAKIIFSDKIIMDNKGKEAEMTKDILGFELGSKIAQAVEQVYNYAH